jgi:membrane fusion protein (multidrug efflux system)
MENNNTQQLNLKRKKFSFSYHFSGSSNRRRNLRLQNLFLRAVHEETDDAQIASNMAPVISKISGYVAGKSKRQPVCKKGDTLVILDNRDQKMALEQAQAALSTAKSNISNAEATTTATSKTSILQKLQ